MQVVPEKRQITAEPGTGRAGKIHENGAIGLAILL
jgi:hypothetical protein